MGAYKQVSLHFLSHLSRLLLFFALLICFLLTLPCILNMSNPCSCQSGRYWLKWLVFVAKPTLPTLPSHGVPGPIIYSQILTINNSWFAQDRSNGCVLSWILQTVKITLFQAEVAEWISSKHNMGMAFTRKEWKKILSCSSKFCKVSP